MKKAFFHGALTAILSAALLAGCASAPPARQDGRAAESAPAAPSAYKDAHFAGGYATLGPEAAAVCDVIFRSDGTCTMTLSESPGSGSFSQDGTYDEDALFLTFKPDENTRPSILGYEPGYTFVKYGGALLMACERYEFTSNDGGATLTRNDYGSRISYVFNADERTYEYLIDGDVLYGGAYIPLADGAFMFENPGERGGVNWTYFVFTSQDAARRSWTGHHCYTLWRRASE